MYIVGYKMLKEHIKDILNEKRIAADALSDQRLIHNLVRFARSNEILYYLIKQIDGSEFNNQFLSALKAREVELKESILRTASEVFEAFDQQGLRYFAMKTFRYYPYADDDIDIIAISKNTKKEITSGKYHISVITLEGARKTIEKDPVLISPRLYEAKTILNRALLEELKAIKIKKSSFKNFIEATSRIIKINKEFIDLDKHQGFSYLDADSVIYSLVLRLRAVFLIKNLINKKKYSKKEFLRWLGKEISKNELERAYTLYKSVRDNKKIKEKIKIETSERLLNMLKKEIKELR